MKGLVGIAFMALTGTWALSDASADCRRTCKADERVNHRGCCVKDQTDPPPPPPRAEPKPKKPERRKDPHKPDKAPGEQTNQVSYSALVERGDQQAEQGRCDRALDLYRKALRIHPAGVDALVGRGYCQLDQNLFTAARLSFSDALTVEANHLVALWGLAEVHERQGQIEQAIAAYERVASAHPSSARAGYAAQRIATLKLQLPAETDDVGASLSEDAVVAAPPSEVTPQDPAADPSPPHPPAAARPSLRVVSRPSAAETGLDVASTARPVRGSPSSKPHDYTAALLATFEYRSAAIYGAVLHTCHSLGRSRLAPCASVDLSFHSGSYHDLRYYSGRGLIGAGLSYGSPSARAALYGAAGIDVVGARATSETVAFGSQFAAKVTAETTVGRILAAVDLYIRPESFVAVNLGFTFGPGL